MLSRQLLYLGFLALAGLAALVPEAASADKIPMTPFSGRQYYYSTSMDPITVHFMWPDFNRPESRIQDTVFLPRAYIVFAAGYASKPARDLGQDLADSQRHGYEELPETIQTDSLRILLTYPDGEPFTVALKKRGRKAGEDYLGTKVARANLFIARVSYISNSHPMPLTNHVFTYEKNARLTEYDGLLYNPGRHNPHYYSKPSDPFFYVYCSDKLAETRPGRLCQYAVPLGSNYLALVDFLDFRLHGGRAFADERIAAFRRAMCEYFPCDR